MSQSRQRWISNLHGADGRLVGSYVYFLCCAGDAKDMVYIKIGITDQPTQRLLSLVNNCAARPLTFGVCNVVSRYVALRIETRLHQEFRAWRQLGEWFKFGKHEKTYFAETRDLVLGLYRNTAWPMKVEVTPVMPVVLEARRGLLQCRLIKRKGDAYHDFCKDGGLKA